MATLNAEKQAAFTLRHTPWLAVLYLIGLVFGVGVILFSRQVSVWLPVFIILLVLVLVDFRHTVSYQEGMIVWKPFPRPTVSIKLSNITALKRETTFWRSNTRDSIAIYDDRNNKRIKLSLTLFTRNDIRKLLQIIHDARPDLTIPEGWAAKQP